MYQLFVKYQTWCQYFYCVPP